MEQEIMTDRAVVVKADQGNSFHNRHTAGYAVMTVRGMCRESHSATVVPMNASWQTHI